jgi:serine/threonine-protein kinase
MDPSQHDDLYRQAVVTLGFVTSSQLDEVLQIQSKIQEIGIREPLGDLLLKKGYLQPADHAKVLRHLGVSSVSIPGFTILAKIGQGGMGTVYKAIQTSFNRIVALKVISQAAAKDPLDVARFVHEARAAASLNHPNLVSAMDVGFSGGLFYFVMEFVVGKSCREIVKTKGPIPPGQVVDVAIQIVDALGTIHESRMVHRDIKPENILLTGDGVVKICDFGLAKSIGEVDASLTQEGFTVGTPFFMSPEQVRGDRDIDIRSDLYSLGATLFFLLTGKPPYEGRSAAETMSMHLKHPVPEAYKVNAAVSEDLSRVLHKLLSKDRRDRYPAPKELKEDLDRIKQGSAPRYARQHAFQLQISSKAKIPQRSTVRKTRSPWTMIGAGAGGVGVVAALFMGALLLSGPGGEARPSDTAGRADAVRKLPEPPAPPRPAIEPGKAEYEEACEIAKIRPEDLAAQARALQRALQKGKDGPYAERARRDLALVDGRLRKELASLEERAKGLLSREQYKEALDLWSAVGLLHDLPSWTEAVSSRIEAIDRIVVERYAAIRERAAQARERQDRTELGTLRQQLAVWGLASYLSEFDGLLATPDPEAPPPPVEVQPKEERSAAWSAAAALAKERDYPAALRSLEGPASSGDESGSPSEAAADRENLLLAAQVTPEALSSLAKMGKGQKLGLLVADPQGKRVRVEGPLLTLGAGRLEILRDETPVLIPFGEILPRSLAELFVAQAKEARSARKAAAVFCLIEGDADAARSIQGESAPMLAPKYWDWARRMAEAPRSEDPREGEARRLFYDAERLYFEAAGAVESAAKYRQLLDKFGQTRFVRRNQAAIEARTAVRKDFVISASELGSRGGFKLVRSAGKSDCLVSLKDPEPAEIRENYVQAEFSVLPESDYRCWVYAGGCCQEVFAFSVQGDEITVPKPKSPKDVLEAAPGTSTWAPVKFVPPFLRKKHAEHGGPKQADRWMWIPVPLPKFATPGTKTLRFLTDQRGFSIALVVVSAQRAAPPKDADLKDLERLRPDEPGYASFRANGGGPTGQIQRELWEGVRGTWVRDLTAHSSFPDRPTKVEQLKIFDVSVDSTPDTGSRIRGYIHPPATGDYVFWIAADDTGELWLSSDERPENKVLIASAPEWTGRHEWEKHASQKSRPVALRAGHRYYIEALEKQGGGGSHLAVGWQVPDGTSERPIPGRYLSPYSKK